MTLKDHYETVVIGGGQAGLSASVCLTQQGVDHVVLERHRVGHAWRTQRWDNFCLVTPNWQCTLPGFAYHEEFGGADPDGFMKRDEIVDYLEAFRTAKSVPVVEGVDVRRLSGAAGDFQIEYALADAQSPGESITAESVVIATGGYHTPRIPDAADAFPDGVVQLHSSQYKNAAALPAGDVLVIGTGQSGCQIAEDLHLEGRRVHLAVGSAPRSPRFYRGRDVTGWLVDLGAYAVTVDEHPLGKGVRKKTNHYLTGRDGGREIDLRRFAQEGMILRGRFKGVEGGVCRFADDLATNLDNADASAERIKDQIDEHIAKHGIDAPPGERYQPSWRPGEPAAALPADGVAAVVWCTGFAKDYGWVEPPAFDAAGEPDHRRGVSVVPGLYFLGLPWMHTWGSGRFSGVAADAAHVVGRLAARRASTVPG